VRGVGPSKLSLGPLNIDVAHPGLSSLLMSPRPLPVFFGENYSPEEEVVQDCDQIVVMEARKSGTSMLTMLPEVSGMNPLQRESSGWY